jgi:cell division protein FtsI (penicillin-binding protein 3)
VDAKSHVMGSVESEPVPGEDLVLTIDANIQYMAERALDEQMAKVKALRGTVVVQDPHTGQILALAVSPRFNPNDSRHMDAGALTDPAVSDVYEPGSTFKLVTYSAALDAAGVQPSDMVDCQGGSMTMYGRTLHDVHSDHYGVVTVQKALEVSSDVGAAKMALKVGPERFYRYMKAYGFGDRSGIELPSETRGLLRPPPRWDSTSILSLAIGQEIGVTPVQLVTMVSTLANGGVYMPPHILLSGANTNGVSAHLQPSAFHPVNQLPAQLPEGAHRVVSELTAARMRRMMEGIVTEGTGTPAALNGYSAGGKTGTAQKIDVATHTYSKTKYVASFAGMAPVSNPAITVAVVIDSPSAGGSYYGGPVSAPVFQAVAQQVLEYLGVPHDQPVKTKELQSAQRTTPDDAPSENVGDLNAMFAETNLLPTDDPLRDSASATPANKSVTATTETRSATVPDLQPAKMPAAFDTEDARRTVTAGASSGASNASGASDGSDRTRAAVIMARAQARRKGAVVVDAGRRVAVPAFAGSGLRTAVETASGLGLRVEPVGSGIAREQAPVAGTMVPVGTEVVVRFAR